MTETKTKAPMSDTWRGKRRARRRGGRKDILVKAVAVEKDFFSVFLTSIDVGEDAEGDTTEERKESRKRQGRKRRRQRAPWRLSIPRPLLSSLLHFSPANTSAQPQPLGQPGSSGGRRSRVVALGKSQGNTHLDLFSGKAFPFSAFLFSLLSPCACFLFHSLCFGLSAVRSDLKHS